MTSWYEPNERRRKVPAKEMVRFVLDLGVIFLTVLVFALLILAENAVTH